MHLFYNISTEQKTLRSKRAVFNSIGFKKNNDTHACHDEPTIFVIIKYEKTFNINYCFNHQNIYS